MSATPTRFSVVKFCPRIKFVAGLFAIDIGVGALAVLWVAATGGI